MFSTRGMPMRSLLRFCIRATRSFVALVHARVGMGSEIFFAFVGRKTSFDAISTKFGCCSRIWSNPALMSFISFAVFCLKKKKIKKKKSNYTITKENKKTHKNE